MTSFNWEKIPEGAIIHVDIGKFHYIAMGMGNKKCGNRIFILDGEPKSFINKKDIAWWHDQCKITEATEQEKLWLQACIRENKFIPKEQIVVEYDIFS